MRYKIQCRKESDGKWDNIGANDSLDLAIEEATTRSKMHESGTIEHRVFDTETTTVKFERGWINDNHLDLYGM